MTAEPKRRELLISKGWVQAAALVMLFGFFVLGLLAFRAYRDSAPIPQRVVSPDGRLVFTGEDVLTGQGLFLRNGLMQYGSVFGHGAYLGPDYTADYLRRAALSVRNRLGGEGETSAQARTVIAFKENRYDAATGTLTLTAEQALAFEELAAHYHATFSSPDTGKGLRPRAIAEPGDTRRLTAFFAWTAWTASTLRPGLDYSYTNNWPPEPLVGNGPTGAMVVWSVLSLIALLGGIGLLFAAFGRWDFLGWHGRERQTVSFRRPGEVVLTAVPARVRVVLPGDGGALPRAVPAGRRHPALPRRADRTSSASTWPPSSPSTSRAPGTCSSPSSGWPRPSSPPASSWRPWWPATSRADSTGWPTGCWARSRWWCSAAWRASSPASTGGPPACGSATRASSTWTSGASGRCCCPWGCCSGWRCSSAGCGAGCAPSTWATCPGSSSSRRWPSPPSTRWACWPGPTRTSPSPTSGASGWCTCGSRTSSSSSPPSWWPTSSCCWAWCPSAWPCASSTWTSSCTRSAASSAPCTTCTSPARRWSTWRSAPSSPPPR